MNLGSKEKLFICFNHEDDVEEMIREVDQTPDDENKESVEIEKEETNNLIEENYSIILAESNDEEKEKKNTV